MLKPYDFERLIDYVKYLSVAKQAELDAKSSRERQQAKLDREWYEAEIETLNAKLGRGQRKILNSPDVCHGRQVVGLHSERVCETCGQWFMPDAPNQKCCCNACKLERRRMAWRERERGIANGERRVVALGQEVKCLWCDKVFVKQTTSHKYCGAVCATAAERKRSKDCYVGKVRMKYCEMCGSVFSYTNHARRYCGRECAERAKGKKGEG